MSAPQLQGQLLRSDSSVKEKVTYFEEFGSTMQQDVSQEALLSLDSDHQLIADDAVLEGVHRNGPSLEQPAEEEGQHAENWLGAEDGIDHLSEGQDPFANESPQLTEGDNHEKRSSLTERGHNTPETSKESTHARKMSTPTVPEPFRFSLDKPQPRRVSDGAVQSTPEPRPSRRLCSPSHTAPPAKPASSSRQRAQTMPQPFNLSGSKRHEKAQEQLKAEIAAKEAEEIAPKNFKARPILRPETAPASRVVAAPTKPSAFKLSVEERAGRRDKFKKQLEERGQKLESEREKIEQDLKKELEKEKKQVRRSATFKAAPAKFTPDDKVFKPKLGQTPTTTPRAPVLTAGRRRSTGSQDGSNSQSKTADTAPVSRKDPSPLQSMPAASRASKAPSSQSHSTPASTVTPPARTHTPPSRAAPLSTPQRAASPKPEASKVSSRKPETPKVAPFKPEPPKVASTKTKAASPKPEPLKVAPKVPSPVKPKGIHPSASTPSSPRPVTSKITNRRNSISEGATAKPSSLRGTAPSRPLSGRASASPEIAKQTPKPRPPSAGKASMLSPRIQALSSSKGAVRPRSAPAPNALKTPPRTMPTPRGAAKATADGSKQAGGVKENGEGEVLAADVVIGKTTATNTEESSEPAEANPGVTPTPDADAPSAVSPEGLKGKGEQTAPEATHTELVQANGSSRQQRADQSGFDSSSVPA